jgi:hypothetical protein
LNLDSACANQKQKQGNENGSAKMNRVNEMAKRNSDMRQEQKALNKM